MSFSSLDDFLRPLAVDLDKIVELAKRLEITYRRLAMESQNQFLPTPISDNILKPERDISGRYLAIDIGGTNLRVGFVELLSPDSPHDEKGSNVSNGLTNGHGTHSGHESACVRRHLERSWPIGEQLKNEKAEDLFLWVGECISEVVAEGQDFFLDLPSELPMGVTFSFPMIQHTLSEATLMSMGKGFAITSNLDLGHQLKQGYTQATSGRNLPTVKIVAIVNDAVATFVSFVYQLNTDSSRKAAMGLIVGTGNNATIPLKLKAIHPEKRVHLLSADASRVQSHEEHIVLNTEWSINGTLPPLQEMDMITRWDKVLDAEGAAPGFMPFEQMTAGRYLGELGRLMISEYLTEQLRISKGVLPAELLVRHGITTTFLGRISPDSEVAATQLNKELPIEGNSSFHWNSQTATVVYRIGKAIQHRAAAMTAAAIIGLLACADELSLDKTNATPESAVQEFIIGYTGGCIVHFHDYLEECQHFLDQIVEATSSDGRMPKVVLQSCHDGGIIGAGVLAGTVQCLAT